MLCKFIITLEIIAIIGMYTLSPSFVVWYINLTDTISTVFEKVKRWTLLWGEEGRTLSCVYIHLYPATLYNPYTNIHFLKGSRQLKGEGGKSDWAHKQFEGDIIVGGVQEWGQRKHKRRRYMTTRWLLQYSGHWVANCHPMEGECHLLCITSPPVLSEQHSTFIAPHIVQRFQSSLTKRNKLIWQLICPANIQFLLVYAP